MLTEWIYKMQGVTRNAGRGFNCPSALTSSRKCVRSTRPTQYESRSLGAQRPSEGSSVEGRRFVSAKATDTSSSPSPANLMTGVPTANVWELDFCSRPILDERGKKVWELLICDADRTWEYSEYFPNNKINSVSLKAALERIMSAPGAVRPEKCKFFRGQMQTIISRALTDVGIKPIPSRRCFTLMNWLEERLETTYSKNPGYNTGATTAFTLELGSPQDLPDALRGEAWAFVQLPAAQLQKEAEAVRMGKAFGDSFDLAKNVKGLKPDTLIPGVAVFSRRAAPLAAWTNGLELAAVTADVERACLVLETGVNQRWRYGAYRRNPNADQEAESWERAKKFAQGLHFLAVQPDAESEEVSGIWLLQNRDLPNL